MFSFSSSPHSHIRQICVSSSKPVYISFVFSVFNAGVIFVFVAPFNCIYSQTLLTLFSNTLLSELVLYYMTLHYIHYIMTTASSYRYKPPLFISITHKVQVASQTIQWSNGNQLLSQLLAHCISAGDKINTLLNEVVCVQAVCFMCLY